MNLPLYNFIVVTGIEFNEYDDKLQIFIVSDTAKYIAPQSTWRALTIMMARITKSVFPTIIYIDQNNDWLKILENEIEYCFRKM